MVLEYVYAPKMRSLRPGSGPDGHTKMDKQDGRGPFGVIVYNRPLTYNEILNWNLATVDMPRLSYYVYGVHPNGNKELLFVWDKSMPGAFDEAVRVAEDRQLEFTDYAVGPKTS